MKKLISFFISLSFITVGFSQEIHSPAEILKILNNSKVTYEIGLLDKKIECKDFSEKLNQHGLYRVVTDSGLYTLDIVPNETAEPLFIKAEAFFGSDNFDSALVYYKLALEADSTLYDVMTYIGQLYEKRRNYDEAIKWYELAIDKNYIDYMAHWFLADNYLVTNNIKGAVDEIVIARILNRNNPRIKQSMKNIFKKAKRDTTDWCFNPQVKLSQKPDGSVVIATDEKWMGYALAKALWTYEPGYSESMGVARGEYSTLEDRECLVSLLVGLENAKVKLKKDRQLYILKKATENKYLQEYILYELLLPQHPFVAFQLPENVISDIKDYVLNIRNRR
ncbi:MAG: tetratricopeptide repeat protein [Chlorobi bacterium]|nr:tetratricopeptide repeat protein [Chlorobiota bacterium]